MDEIGQALDRAQRHSPFVAGAARRHSDLVDLLLSNGVEAALADALIVRCTPLRRGLRVARDRLALVLAIGDLAGRLSLERITGELSAFADRSLDLAIAEAGNALAPGVGGSGFGAIALGKHGGRDLNYSSDIDPILLFDPARVARRARDDPREAAVRLARSVVDLLQTRDGDGYVFRVDLRLRPSPEVTPIALPVDAAISHYESSALPWERAAFVRARVAAGDRSVGDSFLSAVRPFVWRRALDFGAIGELREMSRRIRDHYAKGQTFGPGFDLKRGRGGIRELEFFVQVHQLIHGGRDASLRSANIFEALAALGKASVLDGNTVAALAAAYRVLRTVEHRVQMIDDLQTHLLPADAKALDGVARLHGIEGGDGLLALLAPHVAAVAKLYDALDDRPDAGAGASPASDRFAADTTVARMIADWRSGRIRALRSKPALDAFEAVLPSLLKAIHQAPDPDAVLLVFDAMLRGLPTALNFFRLLQARPVLMARLVTLLGHAPTLAEALGHRAALLDVLIDTNGRDPAPDLASLIGRMRTSGALEEQLDAVRLHVAESRFELGVGIVEGTRDPLDAAAGYARVAEAAVVCVGEAIARDFAGGHGVVPGSELVVLALGRLGGGALTHATDLDLIYLFTGDFGAVSDGKRPLGATHYYNRLAARLSAGLSAPTAAGALYEVDTRLRPSGAQGPLVVSVASFARYQSELAWTWERMALTRARPVLGSDGARAAVAAVIDDSLRRDRDRATLARDVCEMRVRMTAHKPPTGSLDAKLFDGGLVDLEFVVHFHQLASHAGLFPDLGLAIDALIGAQLVGASLRSAHDLLSRFVVTMRLIAPQMEAPSQSTCAIVARACRVASWSSLLAEIDVARQCIRDSWMPIRASAGGMTMVDIGSIAPEVTLTLREGQSVALRDLGGRPVVLYFYPKDDTSGCTREAQDFTTLAADFVASGVRVIGVSKDSLASHRKFAAKYALSLELAADLDGSVCEAFGVWVEKSMYGKKYMGIERATFLIDGAGKIARAWRKVKVPGHAAEVLAAAHAIG